MASGSICKRPRCCEGRNPDGEDLHIPQHLCPACSIRPVVRDRVVIGELISPSFQSYNLIRHLGERGARLHWPTAYILGAHSFRRSAARASMSAGGSYACRPVARERCAVLPRPRRVCTPTYDGHSYRRFGRRTFLALCPLLPSPLPDQGVARRPSASDVRPRGAFGGWSELWAEVHLNMLV